MNESQLISELRAALDDAAATVRAPAGAAGRARRKARRQRLGRGLAVTVPAAGLAAVLAVAVNGPAGPHTGAGRVTAVRLTAVQVLHRAAAAALSGSAIVPRPDQFVYWKTVDSGTGSTQTWRSVDGSRDGFVLAGATKTMLWGCRDGWQTVTPDPGSGVKSLTQPCAATAAYLPGLPAYAGEMRDYLARTYGSADTAVVEKVAEDIFDQNYLLPAQRAALYQFFATLPGLKVIQHARDYAGRPGTAVSMTSGADTTMWIFDPKTFTLLGETDLAGGKITNGSAVLEIAIVDQAGQRP